MRVWYSNWFWLQETRPARRMRCLALDKSFFSFHFSSLLMSHQFSCRTSLNRWEIYFWSETCRNGQGSGKDGVKRPWPVAKRMKIYCRLRARKMHIILITHTISITYTHTFDIIGIWMDLVCDSRCWGPLNMYPLPVFPVRNDVRKAGNKLRQRRRGNLLARLELTEARTGSLWQD